MSTLLVSLGVVGAAVVGVVLIALADPDQPATNRPPSRRDGRRRRRMATLLHPPPSEAEAPPPDATGTAPSRPVARVRPLPDARRREEPMREGTVREGTVREGTVREGTVREGTVREGAEREPRVAMRERRRPAPGWLRLRSGVALVVLVTFVGLVLAALVGTTLALAARALRHAVG